MEAGASLAGAAGAAAAGANIAVGLGPNSCAAQCEKLWHLRITILEYEIDLESCRRGRQWRWWWRCSPPQYPCTFARASKAFCTCSCISCHAEKRQPGVQQRVVVDLAKRPPYLRRAAGSARPPAPWPFAAALLSPLALPQSVSPFFGPEAGSALTQRALAI